MPIKIAINGYGRIGRNVLRAFYESSYQKEIEIVAINDLGSIEANAHLTRFDSTHGRFQKEVKVDKDHLLIEGNKIRVLSEKNPAVLPWRELKVDIVLECTGIFTSKEKASLHLQAGSSKVIISAPASDEVDATIVYGVNHETLTQKHQIISGASCTTNCLAPIAKVLHEKFNILQGLMTTVHAYTNDQVLVDTYHSDLHRARSATHSLIPTKTGAAKSIGLVLPSLQGKLDGLAVRVPTLNVSLVDLVCTVSKKASVQEINEIVKKAAEHEFKGIIDINTQPLVSVDFNHQKASCIFDATQTKVIDNLVKVLAWYDNEWAFANRMLDIAQFWMQPK